MQTQLADFIRDTPEGREADAILRKCVHCGFCTATCPTYQLLGDELDGPRGRIYLIKQVLEGAAPTAKTQPAPGPLPDLPLLRDHLSVGRAVRAAGRHRPRHRGAEGRARRVGARAASGAGVRAAAARVVFVLSCAGTGLRSRFFPEVLQEQNSRTRRAGRRLAGAAPQAQDAGARRLRAAGARAGDQRGGGARARPRAAFR